MSKYTGKRIQVGNSVRDVFVDDSGNEYIINPDSNEKTIIGNIYDEGESLEQGNREFNIDMSTNDLLNNLLNMPKEGKSSGIVRNMSLFTGESRAHDSIDDLITKNEFKKSGSRLSGPLDKLGDMLASRLIGQHEGTGYIPQKGGPELTSRDLAEGNYPLIVGLFDKIMNMTK